MPKLQIIIFACVAAILFMTLTYLLITRFLKRYQSSKAKYLKTIDDLEQDKPFKF